MRVFQYNEKTAKMAPSWIKISKDLTKEVCGINNRFETSTRCPVEETGKNSVIPSTIERINA